MGKVTIIREYPYNTFVESTARAMVAGRTVRFDRKRLLYDLRASWKELLLDIRREANYLIFRIEEGHLYVVNVVVEFDDDEVTLSGRPDLLEL